MFCSLTMNPSCNMWHGMVPSLRNICRKDHGNELSFNECSKLLMYHFFPHRYPSVLGTYINIVKDVVDIAVVHMSTDKFVS